VNLAPSPGGAFFLARAHCSISARVGATLCNIHPEKAMSQVTLLAEFEVKTQDLDLFIAAAKREMQAVGASAAGCLGFEVLLFDEETGKGAFVEVFKDQAAADAHRETPHFSAFCFEEIEDIEVPWSVRRGTAVSVN